MTARWPAPLQRDEHCVLFGTVAADIWPFLDTWDKLEHWFRIRPGAIPDTLLIPVGPATRAVRVLCREMSAPTMSARATVLAGGVRFDAYLTARTVTAHDRRGNLGVGTEVWVHGDFGAADSSVPSMFGSVTAAGLRAMCSELST